MADKDELSEILDLFDKALFMAAVINGFLASPVMAMMMLLTQDRKVMRQFALPGYLRVFGWAGTLVMGAASVALLATLTPSVPAAR